MHTIYANAARIPTGASSSSARRQVFRNAGYARNDAAFTFPKYSSPNGPKPNRNTISSTLPRRGFHHAAAKTGESANWARRATAWSGEPGRIAARRPWPKSALPIGRKQNPITTFTITCSDRHGATHASQGHPSGRDPSLESQREQPCPGVASARRQGSSPPTPATGRWRTPTKRRQRAPAGAPLLRRR